MRARTFPASLALLFLFSCPLLFCQTAAAKYPIVNWQQIEAQHPSPGLRLFFYLLRNDAELLNDDDVLRNFMAANNCLNNAFPRLLTSEFDYPDMKAFYQSKAPAILKTGPTTLSLVLSGFYLGQYDPGKGVFPFVDAHGVKKTPTTLQDLEPGNDLHDACPNINARGVTQNRQFYANYLHYRINVQPVTISELSMDATAARTFIDSLRFTQPGVGRGIALLVDMDLVDIPTKLAPYTPAVGYPPLNIEGRIKKITAISVQANKPLGVIFP